MASLLVGLGLGSPAVATAQDPQLPEDRTPAVVSTEGFATLLTVLTLSSVLVVPHDEALRGWVRSSGPGRDPTLHGLARAFKPLGDRNAFLFVAGGWAVGRLAGSPTLADISRHTAEGILLASAVSGFLKVSAARARPRVPPHDPFAFLEPGPSLENGLQSFPSGHTTVAFAAAAALSEETSHRWPGAARWVRPLLYGAAGLVGLNRILEDDHWASDVVAGAAVGTLVGRRAAGVAHVEDADVLRRVSVGLLTVPGGETRVWMRIPF